VQFETDARTEPLSRAGITFFFILGLAVIIFQTTAARWYDTTGWSPDLALLIVLYLGLHAPVTSGALLICGLGFLRDVAAGGVFGLHPAIYLPLFFVTVLARRQLDPTPPWYASLYVLGAALGAGILEWGYLYLFGRPLPPFSLEWSGPASSFFISVLLTAALGPPVFGILKWRRLHPGEEAES
jgi:rod shape-determining protein MreD